MRAAEIALAFLWTNNLVFVHFLGGTPQRSADASAWKGSWIVGLVLVVLSFFLWWIDHYLLQAFRVEYLRTLVYVGALSLLTFGYGKIGGLNKNGPKEYDLILNSALLGGSLLVVSAASSWIDALVFGFAAAAGYAGSGVLLQAVHSRMAREKVPEIVQGLPLQLLTCGFVSLVVAGISLTFWGTGK